MNQTNNDRGETEPIKITRIEIDTGDVRERFDKIERSQQELKQDIHTISQIWLDTLQGNFEETKSEIEASHGSHNERFDRIETTQNERFNKLETMMQQILDRLPQ